MTDQELIDLLDRQADRMDQLQQGIMIVQQTLTRLEIRLTRIEDRQDEAARTLARIDNTLTGLMRQPAA